MIQVTSNMSKVFNTAIERLEGVDTVKMCKEQATTILALVKNRVHIQGQDSNGSQIGTYSTEYLKIRTGTSKGKPNYNRGSDPKVILSLTRQMENDFIIKPIENGYGIGYSNVTNFRKSYWAELKYAKKIFSLTAKEHKVAVEIAEKYIANANR